MWVHAHAQAARSQRANDVGLESEIYDHNERLVGIAVGLNAGWRDLRDKVFALPRGDQLGCGNGGLEVALPRRRDAGALRTRLAQASCKAARLDASDRWHVVCAEKCGKLRSVVTNRSGGVCNHEST